jgi:outer membrane protein assembly factor BamE (lipoprotein component of BamABCDE complex)
MKAAAVFVLCALLAACSSTGVEVKPEQTADFRPGVTTRQDVLARLGPPTGQSTSSDGTSVLVYSFAATQVRPATFVPFFGALIGGADTRASSVAFTFDANGKLVRSSASSSAVGSALGTTTTSDPMNTDQPRQPQ